MLPEDQFQFRNGTVLDFSGAESGFVTPERNPGTSSPFGDPVNTSRLKRMLMASGFDGQESQQNFGFLRDLLTGKKRRRKGILEMSGL